MKTVSSGRTKRRHKKHKRTKKKKKKKYPALILEKSLNQKNYKI